MTPAEKHRRQKTEWMRRKRAAGEYDYRGKTEKRSAWAAIVKKFLGVKRRG